MQSNAKKMAKKKIKHTFNTVIVLKEASIQHMVILI